MASTLFFDFRTKKAFPAPVPFCPVLFRFGNKSRFLLTLWCSGRRIRPNRLSEEQFPTDSEAQHPLRRSDTHAGLIVISPSGPVRRPNEPNRKSDEKSRRQILRSPPVDNIGLDMCCVEATMKL